MTPPADRLRELLDKEGLEALAERLAISPRADDLEAACNRLLLVAVWSQPLLDRLERLEAVAEAAEAALDANDGDAMTAKQWGSVVNRLADALARLDGQP